jgi:hypothetical protein
VNIWIVVVAFCIAILLLESMQIFEPSGTKAAKALSFAKCIFAFALAVLSGYKTFKSVPPSAPTGELLPRSATPAVMPSTTRFSYNPKTQTIRVGLGSGATAQPLGNRVPLSLTKTDRGLLVSAVVFSLDGKVAAELRDNKWITNPGQYFRLNYDRSSIEIIDCYRTTILQLEYSSPNEIRLAGVFRCETDKTSRLYPQFPSAPEDSLGQKSGHFPIPCVSGAARALRGKAKAPNPKSQTRRL